MGYLSPYLHDHDCRHFCGQKASPAKTANYREAFMSYSFAV